MLNAVCFSIEILINLDILYKSGILSVEFFVLHSIVKLFKLLNEEFCHCTTQQQEFKMQILLQLNTNILISNRFEAAK